jgi:hypothetical protein
MLVELHIRYFGNKLGTYQIRKYLWNFTNAVGSTNKNCGLLIANSVGSYQMAEEILVELTEYS